MFPPDYFQDTVSLFAVQLWLFYRWRAHFLEKFIWYLCTCVCVCLCVLQSPTARRCGWWCSLCACRWWLSPSSSSSSSAPWDTTAACRAPRVRDGVTPAPARQSTRCSFHDIITNLSVRQLCKRGGADLRRVFAQIMQSAPVFFSVRARVKTITPHPPPSLFIFNETNTDGAVVLGDFDISTVLVSSSLISTVSSLPLSVATFISNNHWEMLFITF